MNSGAAEEKKYRISKGLSALASMIPCVLMLIALVPFETGAFVLEGPHILHLTAKALGRVTALQVTQNLTIYPQSPDAPSSTFDETAIYIMPQRFRSDIVSDRIQRTHVVFGNSSLTIVDGLIVIEKSPFDLYQRLLRSRTQSQLMRTVNQLGVETAISSLGRVEETLVFVLGASYPDESVSQLAIDKATFLPLRLLLVDPKPEGCQLSVEIIFRDWRKIQKGRFPFHVVTKVDGQLAREIQITDFVVNPSIVFEHMDMEAVQASIYGSTIDTPEEQKREAVEAVRQGVKDFQKKFE